MHVLGVALAMIIIAVVSSTREGRAEARRKMAWLNWPLGIVTAILWGFLLIVFLTRTPD